MNLKALALSLVAGVATFLVVGVAVTELAAPAIEFSLLVGLPAGLVAGSVAVGLVYLGLADGAPDGRRRVALAFGSFGAAFLVALGLAVGAFDASVTLGLVIAAVVGVLAALLVYARGRTRGTVRMGAA